MNPPRRQARERAPNKKASPKGLAFLLGAPPGTRTLGPLIKSQLLYQPANTINRKFNLNVNKIKMAMVFMSLRINLFIQNNEIKANCDFLASTL